MARKIYDLSFPCILQLLDCPQIVLVVWFLDWISGRKNFGGIGWAQIKLTTCDIVAIVGLNSPAVGENDSLSFFYTIGDMAASVIEPLEQYVARVVGQEKRVVITSTGRSFALVLDDALDVSQDLFFEIPDGSHVERPLGSPHRVRFWVRSAERKTEGSANPVDDESTMMF